MKKELGAIQSMNLDLAGDAVDPKLKAGLVELQGFAKELEPFYNRQGSAFETNSCGIFVCGSDDGFIVQKQDPECFGQRRFRSSVGASLQPCWEPGIVMGLYDM